MLGSVSEAEDIVQEALLRVHNAQQEGQRIESARAYVSTVVTRLCIDHLRSARVRRESYVGEWLPEPLVSDPAADPAGHAEVSDSLSLAFLVLLESLSPEQRAAFLLRDVFDYPYDEIATIIGKTEDNTRQLAVRARRHSRHAGRGSKRRPSGASSWRGASSTRWRPAMSARSRRCWPTTWCSMVTVGARCGPSPGPCRAGPAWRAPWCRG